MTAAAEQALVAKSRAGDCEALASLLTKNRQHHLRTAWRVLRNWEDAEDAVQTAYCNAVKRMGQFRDDGARFSTWLTRIVINQSIMDLRKRRPIDYSKPLDYFPCQAPNPEQAAIERQFFAWKEIAITCLPSHMRAAIRLRLTNLPVDEIAAQLGRNTETVKVQLFRAREILRERSTARGFC